MSLTTVGSLAEVLSRDELSTNLGKESLGDVPVYLLTFEELWTLQEAW